MTLSPDFDLLIFIGRFQPVHAGHLAVARAALSRCRHLLVLCGSAQRPRTFRNPWTGQERQAQWQAALTPAEWARVSCVPLADFPYQNDRWLQAVQQAVAAATLRQGLAATARIGLIHTGDTALADGFPQWPALALPFYPGLSGSLLREHLFAVADDDARAALAPVAAALPDGVRSALERFACTGTFRELQQEKHFIDQYRQGWAAAPHAPNFVTVDALVVQAGHVLLIERDRRPGQGLLALPGGFVDPGERIRDACLRELQEETGLDVRVLAGAQQGQAVFDDPWRSARGRTITHVFQFALPPALVLPGVVGGDDARSAQWVPLHALDPERLFEDHAFIIQSLLGL